MGGPARFPRPCRAPGLSPVLRVRVGSSEGEKTLCVTVCPPSPRPGPPRQERHPAPGEEGVQVSPGSPAWGSPAATTPSALSPAERGEGAEPSTQSAAVPRGEGCGKNSGCQRRMPRAGLAQESGESLAPSPGRDSDPPGGTDLRRYLAGGGKPPAGHGVREGPWCSRGALSLWSLPTELPRCPGTGQVRPT